MNGDIEGTAMKRLVLNVTAGFVVSVIASGCAATMTVSSHVDRSLNFAQYRTFDWGPADALPTGDPRLDRDPFFKDHVQGAVERGLATRGLELTSAREPGSSDPLPRQHQRTH